MHHYYPHLIDGETEVQSSVTARGRDKIQTQIGFIPKAYFLNWYSSLSPLSFFFDFLLTDGAKYLMNFIKLLI